MLVEVCKNPKSPGFNHYLFESVAALIKHGVAADRAQLATYEATLFPAFQIVLQNDVQEFHPYVFQIFAQLIELNSPPLSGVSGVWRGQQQCSTVVVQMDQTCHNEATHQHAVPSSRKGLGLVSV